VRDAFGRFSVDADQLIVHVHVSLLCCPPCGKLADVERTVRFSIIPMCAAWVGMVHGVRCDGVWCHVGVVVVGVVVVVVVVGGG
jgi:hypothetical protein